MDEKSGVHINDGDCVFHLYPEQSLFIAKDEKLKAVTEILNAIKKEASVLCSNYLWHNDSFEIQAENIFGKFPPSWSRGHQNILNGSYDHAVHCEALERRSLDIVCNE